MKIKDKNGGGKNIALSCNINTILDKLQDLRVLQIDSSDSIKPYQYPLKKLSSIFPLDIRLNVAILKKEKCKNLIEIDLTFISTDVRK